MIRHAGNEGLRIRSREVDPKNWIAREEVLTEGHGFLPTCVMTAQRKRHSAAFMVVQTFEERIEQVMVDLKRSPCLTEKQSALG